MNKLLKLSTIASLFLAISGVQAGDAAAGKSKGMKCISCHGLKGISSNPQYPSIAGQKEAFLVSQMEAFKNGSRPVAAKSALFGGLNTGDFGDLAAHFASLPAGSASSKAEAAVLDKGKAVYEMCSGCHGANGEGGDAGPRLAGQHSAYLIKRLGDYKSGAASDESMKGIVGGMSDIDMASVSEFLSSLK